MLKDICFGREAGLSAFLNRCVPRQSWCTKYNAVTHRKKTDYRKVFAD